MWFISRISCPGSLVPNIQLFQLVEGDAVTEAPLPDGIKADLSMSSYKRDTSSPSLVSRFFSHHVNPLFHTHMLLSCDVIHHAACIRSQ